VEREVELQAVSNENGALGCDAHEVKKAVGEVRQ
jgi:hypothetical protein